MANSGETLQLLRLDNPEDPEDATARREKRLWLKSVKGIIAGFLLVFSHIVGMTNLQLLQRRVPDLELNAFRSAGILCFCVLWMVYVQRVPRVQLSDIPTVFLYASILTLDSLATNIGFALAPTATAQSTWTIVLLFSGLILFWCCGEEKLNCPRALSILLCAGGVVLVIQPWNDFSHKTNFTVSEASNCLSDKTSKTFVLKTFDNLKLRSRGCYFFCENGTQIKADNVSKQEQPDSHLSNVFNLFKLSISQQDKSCKQYMFEVRQNVSLNTMDLGYKEKMKTILLLVDIPSEYVTLVGIFLSGLAGLVLSCASLVFKKCACVNEDRMRTLFWSFLLGLSITVPLTFALENPVWPESPADNIHISVHCVASITVWFMYIYSLQHISGNTVSIILSTAVVFFLIPQYTILSSILPGRKNWIEVVGAFVVLIGSVAASLQEMLQSDNQ